MSPLAQSVLLTMRVDRVYSASNLARLLGASLDALNDTLAELVGEGRIRACNNARRERGYCATRAEPPRTLKQPDRSDDSTDAATTVATYPVTRRLEGVLTNYDRSMESHRALAMLVRR